MREVVVGDECVILARLSEGTFRIIECDYTKCVRNKLLIAGDLLGEHRQCALRACECL